MDKTAEYEIVTAYWRLRNQYRDLPDTSEAWTAYIKALDAFCRTYGGGIVEIGPCGMVEARQQRTAEAVYVNMLARAALNLAHYEQRGKR